MKVWRKRHRSRPGAPMRRRSLIALLVPAAAAACGGPSAGGPELSIREARVRPAMVSAAGDPIHSAAYLTIRNMGSADDRLLGAGFAGARRVEIHETRVDPEGLATMRPVESVPIPAGGEIRLEPGGLHIMLMDVKASLVRGDTVRLSLEFAISGSRTVTAAVGA